MDSGQFAAILIEREKNSFHKQFPIVQNELRDVRQTFFRKIIKEQSLETDINSRKKKYISQAITKEISHVLRYFIA